MTHDPIYEKMYYGVRPVTGKAPLDNYELREQRDCAKALKVLYTLLSKQNKVTVEEVVAKAKDVRRSAVNIVFFRHKHDAEVKLTLGEDRMPVSLEWVNSAN